LVRLRKDVNIESLLAALDLSVSSLPLLPRMISRGPPFGDRLPSMDSTVSPFLSPALEAGRSGLSRKSCREIGDPKHLMTGEGRTARRKLKRGPALIIRARSRSGRKKKSGEDPLLQPSLPDFSDQLTKPPRGTRRSDTGFLEFSPDQSRAETEGEGDNSNAQFLGKEKWPNSWTKTRLKDDDGREDTGSTHVPLSMRTLSFPGPVVAFRMSPTLWTGFISVVFHDSPD